MAGTRGYHNYRGNQTGKWKILLAVLLILVILAAGVIMLLQEHIVYDANGVPHMEIPWAQEDPPSEEQEDDTPPADLDLVIQEPEEPPEPVKEEIRAISLPEGTITQAAYDNRMLAANGAFNAVAVVMKGSGNNGRVYFHTASAVSGAVKTAADTGGLVEWLTQEERHTIAQFSCFLDSRAANSNVQKMGLKNTGGYIFYDGNSQQWLDPGKPDAVAYLCQLAQEVAELGFDEILLTDVSYPLVGKLHKINYGAANDVKETVEEGRAYLLQSFLQEMRTTLEPYGVALSIELSETVLSQGVDVNAGLSLADIAPLVDRVYCQASAETVEAYAAAVAAANENADFVPILTAGSETQEGNWLVP